MATSIANPNVSNIQVNTWTNVYNTAPVAGFSGTVRIVVEISSGTIKLTSTTGVSAATGYGNLTNGTATSIAFEGSLSQVNAALQSLQAYNSDANASPTLKVSAVKGGAAYNPVNGHYYEFVSAPGISWTDAKAATANKKFNGLQGYLVTITSAQENEFIVPKLGGKEGWIGASDANIEGTWQWYTGPEGGLQPDGSTPYLTIGKDEGTTFNNFINGTTQYHNFDTGEPNDWLNGSPGEDYAYMRANGTWNDYNISNTSVAGYLVEYGGYLGENPTEVAQSTSSTLTVVATPVITSNGGGTTATINYAEKGTAAVTTVTASDDNSGDTKTFSLSGTDADKFQIDASGKLTFKASPNFEVPTDSDANNSYQVTVRVTDSTGRTDDQALTVNVTNVNEAVSFTSDPVTLTVTDTGVVDTFTPLTGALTASDIDGDAPIFTIQGGTTASGFSTKTDSYGLLTVNSSTGEYSYTPDAAKVNSLAVDSTATSTFTLQVSDGKGSTATQTLTINLTGANDRPVLQADDSTSDATKASTLVNLPTIAEDTLTQGQKVANLLAARVTDVDLNSSFGGILITANAAITAQGTWQYKVSGGTWKDLPADLSATNALALAATTSLSFAPAANYHGEPGQLTVVATDNVFSDYTTNDALVYDTTEGNTSVSATSKTIGITVTSVNDAPVINSDAGAATLGETADYDTSATTISGSLTGSLTAKDVDGAETLSYSIRGGISSGGATVTKDGNYGTLTLDTSTNTWTYAVDNWVGFNALPAGASVTETFTLQVYDEAGATRSQDVVITLQGTNDAPVLIAGGLADQSFTVGQNFKLQLPAHSFTDAEGLNLAYTATLENGDALPAWLTFDEGARTFSGSAVPGAPASLNIKVTASDGSAAVSDIFKLDLVANTVTSGANTPANAAPPTTTNDHLSTTGTASVALTVNDFGNYSDINGDALAFVKIVTPPAGAAGTLKLNGSAVSANQEVAVADIKGGKLTFEPGTSAAAITFQVGDGTAFSGTHTLTVDVGTKTDAVTLGASTQTTAAANTWTAVYSGNTGVLTGYTGTVRVVVEATGGKIKLDYADAGAVTSAGLTAITTGYGSLTDGSASSIAFEGSLTDVNAALQKLQANLATNPNMTLTVSAIKGGSAFNPANGHYYEAVDFNPDLSDNSASDTITWADAKTAAEGRTFNGLSGYLATITSAEENAFILSKLPKDGWIGASDAAVEGNWKWVTGPEAGTSFWSGAAGGTAVGGLYANWNTNQPDNWTSGGGAGATDGEDFAQFFATGGDNPGRWNDLQADYGQAYYVVEYGGIGTVLQQASRTITLTQPASPAPVIAIAGAANYTENALPQTLNPALDLTDADSATLTSATVTISAGKATGDMLAFTNDNAATFGNIAVTQYDAATGVLTLNSSGSSATLAQWEAALKAVTFASSSDAPGTSRTLQWQVNDGSNASNVGTTSITVTPVNDAPVASLPDVTVPAATDWSLSIADAFTDPDGADTVTYSAAYWNGTEWTALPAVAGDGYWLGFDPGTKTFSGNPPANLPALNIQVTGSDGTDSSTSTFTLNLTDATSYAFAANNLGAVTVTGTPTQGETLTAAAPTDSDGVNTATVSYQWQVRDDSNDSWLDVDGARGKASTLTLAQTESGKQLQVLAFYTDKAGVAEIAASTALTIADAEDAGEVTFTAAGLTPDETLTALLSDADGLTNATPTYQWYRSETGANGSWNTISGATQAAYTITTADGNNFLRVGVTYTDDRTGATSTTAFGATGSKVTLGAIKPVALDDTGTVAEAEGTGNATPAPAPSTGNVLTNDNDANFESAGGTGDIHSVTSLRTGGIEGVGTNATDDGTTLTVTGSYGTLVLTKATGGYSYTLNQSNAAVEALKAGQSLIEAFNYTVTDSNSKADIGVLSLTIEGANDAPVITGTLPTTSTQTEDVAGNVDLSALSISDVDSTVVSVQLAVLSGKGKLTASDQGGVTITGSGTDTLTLTGSPTDVSTYLDNTSAIQYQGAENANGDVTLTVSYKDGETDSTFAKLGDLTLKIEAVNDAPVITSNSGAETLSVDYLESRTDAVTTIVANDTADTGVVSYSISGGADADLFQIVGDTGVLTFKNSPNFEIPSDSDNNNTYLVTVRATDAGTPTPALFDEQTITVTVTNDTSAADPIEAGGTEPVTINAPVDNATLNITGSSTTTVVNPVGDLNIANNGSGTALVTGLKTNTTVNATGTGETSIQEPAGDLSIANSGSGTVTVQGDLAGNKVTIANTGIGKVVINNSGTLAVTVDSVNNGQTIGTSGTGPTTINNPDGNLNVENTGTGTVSVDGLNTGATVTTSGTGPNAITNPDGNLSVINNGTGTTTVANLNDDAVLNVNGTGPTVVSNPDADMQLVNNSTGVVTVDNISSGSVFTSTGTGPATITNPAGNLRINNTGSGTITVEDLKPSSTLTTTGTKPVNLDLSHLTTGQSITVDNDGSGTVNMVNVPAGVVVNTTGSTGPSKITDPAGSFSVNNTGVGVLTVEGDLAGDTLTIDGTGNGPVAINNTGTTPVTIASVNNNQTISVNGSGPATVSDPDASLTVANNGTGVFSVNGLKQDATLTTTGSSPTSVNDPVGNLGVANNGTGVVTVNGLNADAKLTASGTGPTTISNPEGSLSLGNTGTGVVTVSGDLAGDTLTIDGTGNGPVAINNTGTTPVTIASVNVGQTISTTGTGPATINDPDGSLSVSNTGTGTVTVTGLNTGSTLTTTGNGATSVSDPDGDLSIANTGTGTVTVTGLNTGATVAASGSGPVTISNPDGDLTIANSGTGTVTVEGLINGKTLNTTGTQPITVDLSHLTSGQTITIDNDGSGVVNLVNVPEGVTVNTSGAGGINYAPNISGVPGTVQGVTVGATASLADFTVDDRDATTLRVTLTTTNGTIGGLTDEDRNTAGIQLTGTATDINTALASATFTAASVGAASVVISLTDNKVSNPVTSSYNFNATAAPTGGGTTTPTEAPTEAPETPVTETIDGIQVESVTVVAEDGTRSERVTVSPVTEGREDDPTSENDELADIPLFWGESTRTQQATTVSLPTGIGVVTEGNRAPVAGQTIDQAVNDLVGLINQNTTDSETTRSKMLAGGESFVQSLQQQNTETLIVNQVTLTTADTLASASSQPIIISGTNSQITTSSGVVSVPMEALIINAKSLPAGSKINLENIEFAVILGDDVEVIGGEGNNIVFAGDGTQTLILGEGNDELHGGGDSDTVGSKGGDDRLYGDAGNDVLFGGTGNDQLDGGDDTDIALFQYALNQYQINQNSDGTWTISHAIEGTDTLKDIEFAEFADQTITLSGSNQWLNVLFQQNISLF